MELNSSTSSVSGRGEFSFSPGAGVDDVPVPVVCPRTSYHTRESLVQQSIAKTGERKKFLIVGIGIFIIGAISVITYLAVSLKTKNETDTIEKQSVFYKFMQRQLQNVTSLVHLTSQGTPQNKALNWMVYEDLRTEITSLELTIQRYIIAVLFYGLAELSPLLSKFNSNWLGKESECIWEGIECKNGYVSKIILESKILNGLIPSEIGKLQYLETLNLAHNSISGEIPVFESSANLKEVILNDNLFSGDPTAFGMRLPNLEKLQLNSNYISGTIPTEFKELSHLRVLDVGNNKMVGSIPSVFLNSANLDILSLNQNSFSGLILDELVKIQNISVINLRQNMFEGSIPSDKGSWKSLRQLLISDNSFDGTVPSEIGGYTSLQVLDMGVNLLQGSIPATIKNLTNLLYLDISFNYLSGVIPETFFPSFSSLKGLYLETNFLNGTLPTNIGICTQLQFFMASENKLEGQIPTEIGDLNNLTELYLELNEFSGSIPPEISELSNLNYFWIYGNDKVTGTIPNSMCVNVENMIVDCDIIDCSCCGRSQCN